MIQLFVLASGNNQIGLGHIKRSLILAEELLCQNVFVQYFSYENDRIADKLILQKCLLTHCELKDVKDVSYLINSIHSNEKKGVTPLLYIDSDDRSFYAASFQKKIVDAGIKLMYATLYNEYYYYAHILLNQNILATIQNFQTEEYTQRLLGPNFFLWGKGAKNMRVKNNYVKDGGMKIFINFGNADPNDLTSRMIRVLNKELTHFSEIIVVVGSLYENWGIVKRVVQEKDSSKYKLFRNPSNIFELMSQSDVAICSMGMTFWELTYQNIPAMILSGSIRERKVCDFMKSQSYAFKLGDFNNENWEEDWYKRLQDFIELKSMKSIKTKTLQKKINIKGTQFVVDAMLDM